MEIVASIQARMGSSRLPGKVLFHLGRHRVLERVVRSVSEAAEVNQRIITTGEGPENEAILEWCDRHDVKAQTGPEENLLKRHLEVVRNADCDILLRVTGDCPFVPPDEIDRLVAEHRTNDARYTTNATDDMPIGTAVDVIDRDVLEVLADRGDTHPVMPLRSNPAEWNVVFSPNDRWTAYADTHIAVDTPDDYWTLVDAVEAVGDDSEDVLRWLSQR